MKRGATFCQVPRLLLNAETPTMLSSPSASSTRYLHLQGIYKVPFARREWQRVIRKQLKRQVLRSFHLCLLWQSVCASALMSQVMSQQWSEWTAVTPQLINNELKFGLSDAAWMSSQQLRRLCPRNSLNHQHIGLPGHQLLLPYSSPTCPSTPPVISLLSFLHICSSFKKKQQCSEL